METSKTKQEEIMLIKAKLSSAIDNLSETYNILKETTASDSIEILFFNAKEEVFYDKVKGTRIDVKHLDPNNSVLGHAYFDKKGYVVQNIHTNPRFNTAIDNPFKINIYSQMVIPVVLDTKVEGIVRFSKQDAHYEESVIDTIKHIMNSLKDIFLNEHHLHDMEMQKHPFTLETFEVYKSLKIVKSTFDNLLTHTENPEIQKLLTEGQSNVDSIFRYLNPNMDNVSRIKNELRQLNKNKNLNKGIKVLIADDVAINVKILTSMLNTEDFVLDIVSAYDGNQTTEVVQSMLNSDHPVDAIFLDHHMPGKLGLQIAEELKSDAATEKIIIVSITNDPDAIKHRKELYDYHISKPFSKKAIEEIVSDIKKSHSI